MPVCQFARACFSKVFKGDTAYGYCAAKKQTYYGFHGHLVISSIGAIIADTFTAANIEKRDVCAELLQITKDLALDGKG